MNLCLSSHAYDKVIVQGRTMGMAAIEAKAVVWLDCAVGTALFLVSIGCAVWLSRSPTLAHRITSWVVLLMCVVMLVAAYVLRDAPGHFGDGLDNFLFWRP
jgi:vacuolar-type H+-ATPase subunit I/STV1